MLGPGPGPGPSRARPGRARAQAGLEGDDDDGGGGGGRISGHVQARYSIAPRDQISRSGNPLTLILFLGPGRSSTGSAAIF